MAAEISLVQREPSNSPLLTGWVFAVIVVLFCFFTYIVTARIKMVSICFSPLRASAFPAQLSVVPEAIMHEVAEAK